jgi:preprotein translocase subunit SecE
MARTSRQQRRQRRGVAAGTPPLQPARPQKAAAEARETALDNTEPRAAPPSEGGSRGFPGVRFVQEAIAELKKVEWPTQQQVVSGTAVVIVACLLVGVYLYANDRLWGYLVQHVLLR